MGERDIKTEQSVIAILVSFILALVLVYIIFVRVQWARQTPLESESTQSGSQFSSQNFGSSDEEYSDGIDLAPTHTTGHLFEQEITALAQSGVKLRYSDISLLDKLSIEYETAFVDKDGILYGYIGETLPGDLKEIVRAFDWEILAIETRNDILGNHLRWDRILFINIPDTTFDQTTGQRLLVAMIVSIDQDNRFIQAPIDKYYAHKNDMKSYFESLYATRW